jgi:hypothetical protein
MAEFLNGWGRGTWGQIGFGEGSVPLNITAPSAGTTGTPVAAVNAQAIVSVGGVTASLGSISVVIQADANVTPASQLAAANLGTAATTSVNNISVSGLSSTSALGTSSLITNNNIPANTDFDSPMVGELGTATTVSNNNLSVSGFSGTSALGTSLTRTVNNVFVDGFASTSSLGTVTTVCKANIFPELGQAEGFVGSTRVWSLIDDTQTPNWEEVA